MTSETGGMQWLRSERALRLQGGWTERAERALEQQPCQTQRVTPRHILNVL